MREPRLLQSAGAETTSGASRAKLRGSKRQVAALLLALLCGTGVARAEEPAPFTDPVILEYVQAPYPEDALAKGIEAIVGLRISLDAEGRVLKVDVIEPAGHGFDQAALEAVRAMSFAPARTESGPVPCVFDYQYPFLLVEDLVAAYERPRVDVTRRTITMEETRRIPGTFGDPVKVVQTLPGAARTPFGTGLLVIRGSNPEDSGVYIDGVRIPIIYHLTGTTSVLQSEAVQEVDYLPGGYGVRFGRAMGGTIDVRTRETFPDKSSFSWGTDILDSQFLFQGKVGKDGTHGLIVGARRSYIDAILPVFVRDTGFLIKPRYWDYQVKWAPSGDARQGWSWFLYGSDDLLELRTPDETAQGSNADTQGDLYTRYGSERLIGSWRQEWADGSRLTVSPSLGWDTTYFGLGQDLRVGSDAWTAQLRTDLEWRLDDHVTLVPGLDWVMAWYSFDVASPFSFVDINDPLVEREGVSFDGHGTIASPDTHLTLRWRPLADADRWLLTPGLRLSSYVLNSKGSTAANQEQDPPRLVTAWDPRVSSRLKLTESLTTKASTGLYQQPPQPQEVVGLGTESTTGFERSWTTSFGFEHRLSEAVSYDIEGFYKSMDRLIVLDPTFVGFGDIAFINAGEGRAYGFEMMARHAPTGPFFGWVSYTFGHARRAEDPTCKQKTDRLNDLWGTGRCWSPFDFDQRHIFSAQGGYDLPGNLGVSAQVQYVTGNPTDAYNAGVYDVDGDFYNPLQLGRDNGDRLPAYMQTSFRIDHLREFKSWQIESYIDFLNAIRGVNPEFTQYSYDYRDSAYVRGLPFIPNLGVEAKFFL